MPLMFWRRVMTCLALVASCVAGGLALGQGDARDKRPATVDDSVRVREFGNFDDALIAMSPDGRQVAYLLREANVERNVNEYVLYVLPLQPGGSTAARPGGLGRGREVFRTTEVYPRSNKFQWLSDSRHLLIMHKPDEEPRMLIARVDSTTGEHTVAYSSDDLDIGEFAASERGDRLIVTGIQKSAPTTAADERRRSLGVVVSRADSPYRLLFEQTGEEFRPPIEIRLADVDGGERTLYRSGNMERWSVFAYDLTMSKDGRRATFEAPASKYPETWHEDPAFKDWLASGGVYPGVLHLFDIPAGPVESHAQGSYPHRVGFDSISSAVVTWSDEGSTYLVQGPRPVGDGTAVSADPLRRLGEGSPRRQQMYAVDAATGATQLVMDAPPPEAVFAFDEGASRIIMRVSTGDVVTLRRPAAAAGPWVEERRVNTDMPGHHAGTGAVWTGNDTMIVGVHQSPSQPPDLYQFEITSRRQTRLTDVNPEVQRQKLGKVERIEWKGKHGLTYWGYVIYPVDYVPGTRYPAAILLSGWDDAFIHGGQSHSSNFPPQALAASNVLVFLLDHRGKINVKSEFSRLPDVRAETLLNIDALKTAKQQLEARGLVDPARVGVMGFSYTSFVIDYLISHPESGETMPWAAGVSCDGGLYNYGGYFFFNSSGWGMYSGPPYGKTRKEWDEIAPAFNAHRVRTPLLQQYHKGGPAAAGELFTALHTQGKPVEQIWFPDGGHPMRKPLERQSSMQQTVDWFRFWLQGYERPRVPEDPDRYVRWRKLREQHQRNERLITKGEDPTAEFLQGQVGSR